MDLWYFIQVRRPNLRAINNRSLLPYFSLFFGYAIENCEQFGEISAVYGNLSSFFLQSRFTSGIL